MPAGSDRLQARCATSAASAAGSDSALHLPSTTATTATAATRAIWRATSAAAASVSASSAASAASAAIKAAVLTASSRSLQLPACLGWKLKAAFPATGCSTSAYLLPDLAGAGISGLGQLCPSTAWMV